LFLSAIGLSVTKAGANFKTIRGDVQHPIPHVSPREALLLVNRVVLGTSAIALAAALGSNATYAAFAGVVFGAIHNVVYKAFLGQTNLGSFVFSFFGLAHFTAVLVLLLLSTKALGGSILLGVIGLVMALFGFVWVLRAETTLALGELAYSYAYPLFAYAISTQYAGLALWAYFLAIKVIDSCSLLVSFVFQPWFFSLTVEQRRMAYVRVSELLNWAALAIFLVVTIVSLTSIADLFPDAEGVVNTIVTGFGAAAAFLLISIFAFMLVARAPKPSTVLWYGSALLVLPVGIFLVLASVGADPLWGLAGALLVTWLLHSYSFRFGLKIRSI
jgi:hypothetical protein